MEEFYMEYDRLIERIVNLQDEASSLVDLMLEATNDSFVSDNVNDWQGMSIYLENIKGIRLRLIYFTYIKGLIYEMENEKDRFTIQKVVKSESETNQQYLDIVIKATRLRGFSDYRCIDWSKRFVDLLLEMKPFFVTSL